MKSPGLRLTVQLSLAVLAGFALAPAALSADCSFQRTLARQPGR